MNVFELLGIGLKGFVIVLGFGLGCIAFLVIVDLIAKICKAIKDSFYDEGV